MTYTVRRLLHGPTRPPEFLRTATGTLLRFRSHPAAIAAAAEANKALEVAA